MLYNEFYILFYFFYTGPLAASLKLDLDIRLKVLCDTHPGNKRPIFLWTIGVDMKLRKYF